LLRRVEFGHDAAPLVDGRWVSVGGHGAADQDFLFALGLLLGL